jgi:uncharacterized protein (DUF2141 family)
VRNEGPSDATEVVVTDELPEGVSFKSATGGATHAGGVVTWNVGSLGSGASDVLTIVVTVDAEAERNLENTARVAAHEYDTNTENNTAVENTAILKYIVISLVPPPSTPHITAGESVTYAAEAFDVDDNSLGDITSATSFSIETGAMGSWVDNTYTSEKSGRWLITGTYYTKSDTNYLVVKSGPHSGFLFDEISSPKVAGVPFSVTITAVDEFDNIIDAYAGTASLTNLSGAIDPTTADFVSGVWTGDVTIAVPQDGVVIRATDGDIWGDSNAFDVKTGPTVSGFVFNDTDRDGEYDIGDESGIAGVTVELVRGEVTRTTTTDIDGSYSFEDVVPGSYRVVETNLAGYTSTTPDEVHIDVVLAEGKQVDFGDVLSGPGDPAVIYGTVFDDINGNGEQDDEELGIAGVTVTLDGEITTTTGKYGQYTFRLDTASVHTVVETDLPGYTSTTPNEVHVDVTLGGSYRVDFGDATTDSEFAIIYGTVFDDANGNGEQDDEELGIPGVTVTLDGEYTTTTDEYGQYIFRLDAASVHTVVETDLPGYTSTTPNEVHIGVTLGRSYRVDFGDASTDSGFAVIYGSVFDDVDGNSDWDDNELGIRGVTVTLDGETTTTTDEYGQYTFRLGAASVHTVVETDLPGYISITPNEVDVDVTLGGSYRVDFADRILPPLSPQLSYIVISPDTASITAGGTQSYTAEAFDTSNTSMGDVTSSTTFSVDALAGGSWAANTYTSENVGDWTVTGTYNGKSDTAALTVTNNSDDDEEDGDGDGDSGEPRYLTVDFLGEITRVPISDSGELLSTLQAPSPDGRHLLEIKQGTIVTDSQGNVVTLIEITEAVKPGLPVATVILGDAYDFQPSGITFSGIPASITLAYDVNELPQNVVSVALGWYTADLGWTEAVPHGGVVAELGKETAEVWHFTIFAVLARVGGGTAPSIDQPVADYMVNNLVITTSVSEIWEFLKFVVTTGEEATIAVEVTNIGGKSGTYTAFLKLDGTIVATQKVNLEIGQTETITFSIGPNEPGIYQVEIGGLTGEFESSVWINWGLILGLPAGLILLAIILWYLIKRRKAQAV